MLNSIINLAPLAFAAAFVAIAGVAAKVRGALAYGRKNR